MPAIVDPAIEEYATEHSAEEPVHLQEIARATRAASDDAQMMVGRLEGRLLRTLVHLAQATRVLEIGTFTGYSALSMAEALPADGRIVSCELDPERAAMARRHIEQAGYGDRIEIRVGPAIDTVRGLDGPFDLVFIDADKPGYGAYYEAVLPLLAPAGVIAVDNVLWSGRVLDPSDATEATRALVAFNDLVARDPRVDCVMLPIRDGLTLITLAIQPGRGGGR
jgi:caffeoyl-CoA O-methyltransferase